MPSKQRREEASDFRADRLESVIRSSEVANHVLINRKQLAGCSKCKRTFEEISKVCPFCETRTMGWHRPIPDQHKDEAYRNAVKRAQAKVR